MQSVILTLDGAVETFTKGMRWMPPDKADQYCAERRRREGEERRVRAGRQFNSEAELIAAARADGRANDRGVSLAARQARLT